MNLVVDILRDVGVSSMSEDKHVSVEGVYKEIIFVYSTNGFLSARHRGHGGTALRKNGNKVKAKGI